MCRFDASKWQYCTNRDFQPEQVLVKCKLDRASWRTCSEPERLRGLTPDKDRLRVSAVDEAGKKSIVAKRWRVWRRR